VKMLYIVGILGIAALIVIHELGHFVVARLFRMRVKRFSIGFFKPLLEWKPKGSETTYSIGALPLGGYVQIDGLGPTDPVEPGDRGSYANQPAYAKLAMVVAGPAANFVAAVAIFYVLLLAGLPVPNEQPVLGGVVAGLPAARAGLREGDRIVAVDGDEIDTWNALAGRVHASPGKAISIRYRRGRVEREVELVPEQQGRIGIIGIEPSTALVRAGPVEAAGRAFAAAGLSTASVAITVYQLATGRVSTDAVAGPIGIVQISVRQLEAGWRSYLSFVAQLSLSLCLLNFLPIPALDGGRVTFMLFEVIARRRANRTIEGYVHAVGFLVILALLGLIVLRELRACF